MPGPSGKSVTFPPRFPSGTGLSAIIHRFRGRFTAMPPSKSGAPTYPAGPPRPSSPNGLAIRDSETVDLWYTQTSAYHHDDFYNNHHQYYEHQHVNDEHHHINNELPPHYNHNHYNHYRNNHDGHYHNNPSRIHVSEHRRYSPGYAASGGAGQHHVRNRRFRKHGL